MDILTLNTLQRVDRQGYNQYLPERPVFAYYSASGQSAMIDMFAGERCRPMRTWFKGGNTHPEQPNSLMIQGTSEVSQTYYWGNHASTQLSTNVFSPTSGYNGLSSHANTMLLNGFELTSEGYSVLTWESTVQNTHASLGVVLGESSDYQQGINLLKYGSQIFVDYTDDPRLSIRTSDTRAMFSWPALTGIQRLSGAASTSFGDIGYNRTTNMLAFTETNTSNSISRLHIFKNLPEKIRANADHLKAMLEDAIAGRKGASYETFDFTWAGGTDTEWHHSTIIVPCDDGTFWLARQNCNGGGNGYGLTLARIYFSGTTRTFSYVGILGSNSTVYGRAQGSSYGARHMMSDDQNMVAIYASYYYYTAGGNFFFVPRDSAASASRYKRATLQDTSYGLSIAPAGKSDFVIGWASNGDNKFSDGALVWLRNDQLNGGSISLGGQFSYCAITGYSASTSYNGNGFVKVQPPLRLTTEWNERIVS